MIEIKTIPNEESTVYITVTFYDKDGTATAPDSVTWTLTDEEGNIINEREDVEIDTPESSEEIKLSGNDLKSSDSFKRVLTVESVLNGDPLKEEGRFNIGDLLII
jgi:hypothetical protein